MHPRDIDRWYASSIFLSHRLKVKDDLFLILSIVACGTDTPRGVESKGKTLTV
jgi:hypothetical protein